MINIKKKNRIQRVSQEIHKNISVILKQKVQDPRIGLLTVSGINISKDFKYAKVFVTFLDKENLEDIRDSIEILQNASRFIRFWLANTMCLRIVPFLCFQYDSSLIKGRKMYSLIESIFN